MINSNCKTTDDLMDKKTFNSLIHKLVGVSDLDNDIEGLSKIDNGFDMLNRELKKQKLI